MVSALLVAGILSFLAGLVAIVYGISFKDFSFGSTMMIVGATAICTGMLMIGLWVVVGELRNIARRLVPRGAAESFGRAVLPASGAAMPRQGASETGFLFSRDEPPPQEEDDDFEPTAPPVSPQPWQEELAPPRDRLRAAPAAMPDPTVETAPLPRLGRDRLFSTSRKDRDRTPVRPVEPTVTELRTSEVTQESATIFENAWPKLERSRAGDGSPARRSARPAPTSSDSASADRSAPIIIKSGIVDGMAYSLYSDGSIEAQMPEGMMRFGSIDELRAHLDQRQQ